MADKNHYALLMMLYWDKIQWQFFFCTITQTAFIPTNHTRAGLSLATPLSRGNTLKRVSKLHQTVA